MRLIIILLVVATACHVCKQPSEPAPVASQPVLLGYTIDYFKYGDTIIRAHCSEDGSYKYEDLPVVFIAVQYNNIYVRPIDKYGTPAKELDVLDRSVWCCFWVRYRPEIIGL